MDFWNTLYRHLVPARVREKAEGEQSSPASPVSGWTDKWPSWWTLGSERAMQVATVFRCVRLLSESVANLPLKYMRKKGDIFVEDTDSSLHYLLTIQPSETYNAFDFWAKVVEEMLLEGNAYIVPVMSKTVPGEYDRLVLCTRHTVSYDDTYDIYEVSDNLNGLYGTFREDEIIHIKNVTRNGKRGLSTLSYASLATGIARTGDMETKNRFANGGNVRGIVSNDKSVRGVGEYQDTWLQSLAEQMDKLFQSGSRIASVPGHAQFQPLSLSSTDMQFLESRKFTVREICRFFGVHPSFVFDDTSNNYKSAEMANVAFLSNTLNPILRKIECELHRKLVGRKLCCKRKFEFDRKSLYACDLDSRVKYQAQTIAAGIYSVNDWRLMENQPRTENGDMVMISANLKSLSSWTDAPASTTTQNNIDDEPTQDTTDKDAAEGDE